MLRNKYCIVKIVKDEKEEIMPKVKFTIPKNKSPAQNFITNMEVYKILKDKSEKELAVAGRMSVATYYNRRRHPEQLRLYEMLGISRALDVPFEVMVGQEGFVP